MVKKKSGSGKKKKGGLAAAAASNVGGLFSVLSETSENGTAAEEEDTDDECSTTSNSGEVAFVVALHVCGRASGSAAGCPADSTLPAPGRWCGQHMDKHDRWSATDALPTRAARPAPVAGVAFWNPLLVAPPPAHPHLNTTPPMHALAPQQCPRAAPSSSAAHKRRGGRGPSPCHPGALRRIGHPSALQALPITPSPSDPPRPPFPTTQWSARRPPCALQPEPQRRVSLLAARGEEEEEEGQCQARPQVPVCSLAVPSPGPPSPVIVA